MVDHFRLDLRRVIDANHLMSRLRVARGLDLRKQFIQFNLGQNERRNRDRERSSVGCVEEPG